MCVPSLDFGPIQIIFTPGSYMASGLEFAKASVCDFLVSRGAVTQIGAIYANS